MGVSRIDPDSASRDTLVKIYHSIKSATGDDVAESGSPVSCATHLTGVARYVDGGLPGPTHVSWQRCSGGRAGQRSNRLCEDTRSEALKRVVIDGRWCRHVHDVPC